MADMALVRLDLDEYDAQAVGLVDIQDIDVEFDIERCRFDPCDLHGDLSEICDDS